MLGPKKSYVLRTERNERAKLCSFSEVVVVIYGRILSVRTSVRTVLTYFRPFSAQIYFCHFAIANRYSIVLF